MTALQFLSSLPALLGLTGFIIYYFVQRNRGGDRVTLEIVHKLRTRVPERLPPEVERIDASSLVKLLENDANLRSKVDEQDFQLLRDALRQQFISSLVVYSLCGFVFLVGVGFYVYVSTRSTPVKVGNLKAESANPEAGGLPVDLDALRVSWTSSGDPEDIKLYIEEMESHRRTSPKTVRSTEGQIVFSREDYNSILVKRGIRESNRMRVIAQTQHDIFPSPEFQMYVGVVIAAIRFPEGRIVISSLVDNKLVQNYTYEAKLLVWKRSPGNAEPVTFGGNIRGKGEYRFDPADSYDWSDVKIIYIGPDRQLVRTELIGFQ